MTGERRPKFWRESEFYFALLLIGVVALLVALTIGLPRMARQLPLLVGALGLALGILIVVQYMSSRVSNILKGSKGTSTVVKQRAVSGPESQVEKAREESKKEAMILLRIILWIVGCFVLLYLLGILPCTVIFLFCFFRFQCSLSTVTSLKITAGSGLLGWAMFKFLMGLEPLEPGLLQNLLS